MWRTEPLIPANSEEASPGVLAGLVGRGWGVSFGVSDLDRWEDPDPSLRHSSRPQMFSENPQVGLGPREAGP